MYLGNPDERICNWALHKAQPHIQIGINHIWSAIPLEIWNNVRKNTNAAEQSHFKSNANTCRRLPLLLAITRLIYL